MNWKYFIAYHIIGLAGVVLLLSAMKPTVQIYEPALIYLTIVTAGFILGRVKE